jgi:hypothetical protein
MAYQAEPLIEMFCNRCPVVLDCLDYAEQQAADTYGIWGGMWFPDNDYGGKATRGLKKRKVLIDAQRTSLQQRLHR